jgi:hypothetical protein
MQRRHKNLHRRVKEGKKSRIRDRNRSSINTNKDKRPIINIQRGTRRHYKRNTETTDNGGQKSDIYSLTKNHDGHIQKQSHEKSKDQKNEVAHW